MKKGLPMPIVIGLVSIVVIIAVIIGWRSINRPPEQEDRMAEMRKNIQNAGQLPKGMMLPPNPMAGRGQMPMQMGGPGMGGQGMMGGGPMVRMPGSRGPGGPGGMMQPGGPNGMMRPGGSGMMGGPGGMMPPGGSGMMGGQGGMMPPGGPNGMMPPGGTGGAPPNPGSVAPQKKG